MHPVHFLYAGAEHDEWAEWSVKAVFSLITLRCLIRARVCVPSHRRSYSLILWQPGFRRRTIIRQMWETQSTSERDACCSKALGGDAIKVYFRFSLNMKLPVSSKTGCLLIVLKWKVGDGGTEPFITSRFIQQSCYIVSKSGVVPSVCP